VCNAEQMRQTPIQWPLFQDNLGKLVPEKVSKHRRQQTQEISIKVRQRNTINHLSRERIIKFNTDTLTELTLVTERHRPLDQTDSWVDSHTGSLFYCSNNNKTVMMLNNKTWMVLYNMIYHTTLAYITNVCSAHFTTQLGCLCFNNIQCTITSQS